MVNNYNHQSPSRKPFKGLPILLNKGTNRLSPKKRVNQKEKKPVETFSVTRVQPRTSKGHHRPVIALNFLSLDMNSPFKKQIAHSFEQTNFKYNSEYYIEI